MTDAIIHRADAWNDASAHYERLAEPFTSRFGSVLARRLDVRPGERALEVAAGAGALALELAAAGASVLAVDHSPAMAARVAERAAAAGVADRVDARAMDGQALDLPDGAFDVALSAFGVFLFPDHEAGLRELVRVLRPGGRAGLATWRNPEGAGPALLLKEAHRALFPDRPIGPMPPGVVAWSAPDGLARSMAAAGLVEVAVELVEEDWTFPSPGWVAENAPLMCWPMPIWAAADEADRARLARRMAELLAARERPAVPSPGLVATGVKPGA